MSFDYFMIVLIFFWLVIDQVIPAPTSIQIKYIYPSQRIQIEFNQTIKYPLLINKSSRLTYEESLAHFLQSDPNLTSNITRLSFSMNNLGHFPNKLLSLVLANLTEINFSQNFISSLNSLEDFSKMTSRDRIEAIDLSFNNLSIVDDENFRYLSNLKLLNLSHNLISQISLFAFSVDSDQITHLDLSHNLITDSSLEFLLFSNLINIKWLNMDHNRLTHLSNHFLFNLYNLEYLSISNNQLKSLNLFYLVNKNNQFLKFIDLSNNFNLKFKVYERNLENEASVQNNVETLNLSAIDLSNFNLNIFLDNLFDKYKKLKVLNLSSARIKSIVWSTKWPQTLKVLDLSNNFLKNSQFDCSQFHLSNKNFNLTKIDLSNNEFDNFAHLVKTCSAFFNQTNVDLQFNKFERLNGLQSSNCTSTSFDLKVAFNPFICDCKSLWWRKFNSDKNFAYKNFCIKLSDFSKLKCDSMSSQSIYEMSTFDLKRDSKNPIWKISTFDSINSSFISSFLFCPYKSNCPSKRCSCCSSEICDCASICPNGCRCARDFFNKFDLVECTNSNLTIVPNIIPKSATELKLNQNSLKRIYPFQFFSRPQLLSIDLSENKIAFIEENGFNGIKNLKILKLSNNFIQILLGYEFKDLLNLEQLYLNSNKIQFLSNQTFQNLPKLKVLNLMHNNLRHFLEVNVFFRFNINLFNLTIDHSKLIDEKNKPNDSKHQKKIRIYDDFYFYDLILYNLAHTPGSLDEKNTLIKCILNKFKSEVDFDEKNFIKIFFDNLLIYKSFCDQISSPLLKVSTYQSRPVKNNNLNTYFLGYLFLASFVLVSGFLLLIILNKYRKKSNVSCFKHLHKILKSNFLPFYRKRYEITDFNHINKRPNYDLLLIYNKMDTCLVTKLISPIFRTKPYNFKIILQHDKIKLNNENLVKYVVDSAFVLFVLSKNLLDDIEYDLAQKLPRSKKLAILADDVPENLAEKLIQPGRILRGSFNLENMSFNFRSINIYDDSLDSGFDNDQAMEFDSLDESFLYKQGAMIVQDDFENIQIKCQERKIEF